MELNWLEDLIELAAVRNFSTAAAARRITQPAFSRRVRALENWVGAELIDRSSYPVSLTKAGETLLVSARELTREIYRLRDECRQLERVGTETLSFSALHSIALAIFPDLLARIEREAGPFVTRMEATDFYDCIESLALDRCDFALCFTHPLGPPVLETGQFVSKTIGNDPFVLLTACDEAGAPVYRLPDMDIGGTLPLIAYSSGCFLGKIQSHLVGRLRQTGVTFSSVYENSMSEAIKRMVMVGKGVGWLPLSTASDEVARKKLAIVEIREPVVDLKISVFRKTGTASSVVERFWSLLPT